MDEKQRKTKIQIYYVLQKLKNMTIYIYAHKRKIRSVIENMDNSFFL